MALKRDVLSKVYWLGPMGSQQINMKELNGMTPEQHAASIIKDGLGYFKRVNESTDHCMLPYVSPFIGDKNWYYSPKYAYYYSTVEDKNYIPIKLTSETTATLPSNRSRTEIGVGEEVTVEADRKVSWKFRNENLVSISYQDQDKIVFSALDKEGAFTAIAYTENAENQISFEIKAPQAIEYELSEYKDANGQYQTAVFHKQGEYELGIGLRMVLYPLSVNFGALIIKEIDSAATKTGIFDNGRVSCHIRGKGQSLPMGTKCDAESLVTDIGTYNNKHNRATELDIVGGGENDPNLVSNLPKLSSMKLNIPVVWKLNEAWHPLTNVVQQVLLNDQKQLTITKGNFSKTVNVNDPTEGGVHPSKW